MDRNDERPRGTDGVFDHDNNPSPGDEIGQAVGGVSGTVAGALTRLVRVDRTRPLFSRHVPLRHELVAEHADELLLLADRLQQLEPVDVGTLAELASLVADGRSPVYAGGEPPSQLARILTRALRTLDIA